jgi:hypothetical protein
VRGIVRLSPAAALSAALIGPVAALAGPPALCGYYPNSLVPRACGGIGRTPPHPTVQCRDGSVVAVERRDEACARHGGVRGF